jgi:antitoxin (DNA-binding transcriptional repressor) of toxin-antitoxin stability system
VIGAQAVAALKAGLCSSSNQVESLAVREVSETEAKRRFSALVQAVEKAGETVLITRDGRVVARLEPLIVAKGSQAQRKSSDANLTECVRALREKITRVNLETDGLA